MLNAKIISDIEYWDPKKGLVGFSLRHRKYTAYLPRGGTIFNPDSSKNTLVWFYDSLLKDVDSYMREPSAFSVVFPLTFSYKVGITDTPIANSKLTGSSDIVGINQSIGFRDDDANGVYMDESGIYLRFGKTIVTIGEDGVYIDSGKYIYPTGGKSEILLEDNQLNILPSFAVLPVSKDIIDVNMFLSPFE